MALLPTAQSLHPEGTGGGGGGKLLSSSESFPLEKTTRRAFGSRSFWGWAKTGRLPAAACKQAEGKEVGGEGGVETRARRRGHLPWNDPCSPAPCPPPAPQCRDSVPTLLTTPVRPYCALRGRDGGFPQEVTVPESPRHRSVENGAVARSVCALPP